MVGLRGSVETAEAALGLMKLANGTIHLVDAEHVGVLATMAVMCDVTFRDHVDHG
jgi:hypothetical protein